MGFFGKLGQAAVASAALALVVACGSNGDGSSSTSADLPDTGKLADAPAADESEAACKHLTEGEITEAIGPNDGGQHDYLLGGCVWKATSGPKDGLVEAIFATVLPQGQYEAVAEIGEPVEGFGAGATYATLHGELWFPCRNGDFCGVKVDISDSDKREDVAMRLGRVLQGRV